MLQLLLKTKTTITDKNIIYLLEIEVDVIVMVSVLSPMPLLLPLLLATARCIMHVLPLSCSVRAETVLCMIGLLFNSMVPLPWFA